ncbi:MAG: 3-oxoacyl-ACP reductase FabG [Acidobacteriales bacterium]|nr:3-oxoacyl-ACP reductase FabG [Terriglobales bacterium]
MKISLERKVALITGGSRGIGAATVRLFHSAGAQVAFNYHSNQQAAEKLLRELGTDRVAAFQCDLSAPEPAQQLVDQTVARFGRVDVLVANHGVWPPADVPVETMTEEQWCGTVAINLDSVFGLIKHAVAQMKRQSRVGAIAGKIVLISSTAGQRGEAFHCDYAATKGALISMTKGLATELASSGIYVNCVAPGWVATEMAGPALNDPKTRETIQRAIPLGRPGTPEEIAAPVLFLCSDHANFITGEICNVNGGAVLVG